MIVPLRPKGVNPMRIGGSTLSVSPRPTRVGVGGLSSNDRLHYPIENELPTSLTFELALSINRNPKPCIFTLLIIIFV